MAWTEMGGIKNITHKGEGRKILKGKRLVATNE